MTISIADLEQLTEGAVWHRADGRASRVLFVTNKTLPVKVQEVFPQMVVYADENDNVLSVPVDRFVSNRKFYNVEPELESRLLNLLALAADSGEDEEFDLEGDTLEVEGDDLLDDTTFSGTDVHRTIVNFTPHSIDLPVVIDPLLLASLVSSYQQLPGADNTIQHALFIRAEGVTKAGLKASFSPSNEAVNAVFDFTVETRDEVLEIGRSTFVGVFPAVFYDVDMYQVVFTTDAPAEEALEIEQDFAELEAAVDAPAAPAVTAQPVVAAAPAVVIQPQVAAQPAVAAAPAVTIQPQVTVA